MGATVSIFMPAFNAAESIAGVIERIPESLWPHLRSVWIINDGSRDATREEIDRLAAARDTIKPVHFSWNRGYGRAVREGLRRCLRDGCDVAACLHADGQYPPELLPEFVEAVETHAYDILQGSRIASGTALAGGMPLYKLIAGKVLTFFENRVFGLSLSDYHSGYLVYSRRALERIDFERLSSSFDFDLEMIASARAAGLSVAERPIPTRYAGEISYLNPIAYGLRVVGVLVAYACGGYRERRR
jgi:glycosyltransferase involved in cell wall biosynthesis